MVLSGSKGQYVSPPPDDGQMASLISHSPRNIQSNSRAQATVCQSGATSAGLQGGAVSIFPQDGCGLSETSVGLNGTYQLEEKRCSAETPSSRRRCFGIRSIPSSRREKGEKEKKETINRPRSINYPARANLGPDPCSPGPRRGLWKTAKQANSSDR